MAKNSLSRRNILFLAAVVFCMPLSALAQEQFFREADKSQLDVAPINGVTTAKTVASLYELNPTLIAKLKDILIPKR